MTAVAGGTELFRLNADNTGVVSSQLRWKRFSAPEGLELCPFPILTLDSRIPFEVRGHDLRLAAEAIG